MDAVTAFKKLRFPANLEHKNYWLHAAWALALIALYGLGFAATFSDNRWWLAAGTLACVVCTLNGFAIAHECSHANWFKSKRWNIFFGRLLLLPTLIPFEQFRYRHGLHHAKTNDISHDDAWRPLPPGQSRAILYLDHWVRSYVHFLGPLLQTFRNDYALARAPKRMQTRFRVSLAMQLVVLACAAILLMLQPQAFIFGFFIPVVVAHQTLALLSLFHHGVFLNESSKVWQHNVRNSVEHQLNVTYDSPLPRVIEWFVMQQNYHVSHHLQPKIPFYRYRRAHRFLAQQAPDKVRTCEVSWRGFKRNIENNRRELASRLEHHSRARSAA